MARAGMHIGLLGGSFNPVHNGHLRAALEMYERLGLDRVEFLPAHQPPHKPECGVLDFDLRCSLIEMALGNIRGLGLNTVEGERQGPSYTWDTLEVLQNAHPENTYHFIMGANDLLTLPSWHKGLELHTRAPLAVFSRLDVGIDAVQDFVSASWPDAVPDPSPPAEAAWLLDGSRIDFAAIPRLDISASLIRRLWSQGRSIQGLTPRPVVGALQVGVKSVTECWE